MSARHRDALAHLLYGVGEGGGFILLTGEVGTGKTTINRCLLEQLPQDTDIAIILNPALNAQELLASVCDEFGITYGQDAPTLKTLTDALHQFLLENHQRGRKTVLLIDEAQHLDFEVLEQIRLLTNLETNSQKLLQIILIGQPELTQMLARPELRQLNQRITARYNLEPLNLTETGAYIAHRLQVAGMRADQAVFGPRVVRAIHKETGGIPRLINVLCDRVLLGAYGRNKTRADMAMLKLAVQEVMGDQGAAPRAKHGYRSMAVVVAVAAMALTVVALWWFWQQQATPAIATGPQTEQDANLEQRGDQRVLQQVKGYVELNVEGLAEPNVEKNVEPDARQASEELAAVVETAAAPAQPENIPPRGPRDVLLAPGDGLATLWQLHAVTTLPENHCPRGVFQGVKCTSGEAATWDELAQYGRPLLLEMVTPERFGAEALLLDIENTMAWMYTPDGERSVPLAELASLWTGGYRFLWRPPAGFVRPLSLGDEGAAVATVATLFAQLDGQPEPLSTGVFNEALQQRVRLFQRDYGLTSDGVVGMQTLLELNEALGLDVTPALARVRLRETLAPASP